VLAASVKGLPTLSGCDRPEAVVRRCTMGVCSWPKGACQGVTSVARDDHLLSQSLIELIAALIASIWHR
jgi:hypothetical protein